jgi:hypothetical protein
LPRKRRRQRSHYRPGTRAPFDELDRLAFWTRTCTGCGLRIWAPIPPDSDPAELLERLALIYGEPPLCATCQYEARL